MPEAVRTEKSAVVYLPIEAPTAVIFDEISTRALAALVRDALDFPIPLVQVTERVWALELFHGPTRAFKDVGARVQARLLHHFTDGTPLTILVATSGDTGSAVAGNVKVPADRSAANVPASGTRSARSCRPTSRFMSY